MNEFLNGMLLENGYDALSVSDQNVVIAFIADQLGKAYNKVTDEDILNYHKRLKEGNLSNTCDQTILEGFTASNGHMYRTNQHDQIFMMGQKFELLEDETIQQVPWKTLDADYVMHTREEWLMVYKEAFAHIRKQLFKYNDLKNAVNAAKSHPEIVAIKWD